MLQIRRSWHQETQVGTHCVNPCCYWLDLLQVYLFTTLLGHANDNI